MKCLWIISLGTSQKGESLERISLTARFRLARYNFCILVVSLIHPCQLGRGADLQTRGLLRSRHRAAALRVRPTGRRAARISVRVCAHCPPCGEQLRQFSGHSFQFYARLHGLGLLHEMAHVLIARSGRQRLSRHRPANSALVARNKLRGVARPNLTVLTRKCATILVMPAAPQPLSDPPPELGLRGSSMMSCCGGGVAWYSVDGCLGLAGSAGASWIV